MASWNRETTAFGTKGGEFTALPEKRRGSKGINRRQCKGEAGFERT